MKLNNGLSPLAALTLALCDSGSRTFKGDVEKCAEGLKPIISDL